MVEYNLPSCRTEASTSRHLELGKPRSPCERQASHWPHCGAFLERIRKLVCRLFPSPRAQWKHEPQPEARAVTVHCSLSAALPPGVHSPSVRFYRVNTLIPCDLWILFFRNLFKIGYICTKHGAFNQIRLPFVAPSATGRTPFARLASSIVHRLRRFGVAAGGHPGTTILEPPWPGFLRGLRPISSQVNGKQPPVGISRPGSVSSPLA